MLELKNSIRILYLIFVLPVVHFASVNESGVSRIVFIYF